MTIPIPELQVGDVVHRRPKYVPPLQTIVLDDTDMGTGCLDWLVEDMNDGYVTRITRRVVVDGKEQEVVVWQR